MPKGKKREIRHGEKFGRLEIIEEVQSEKKGRYFLCKCECGEKSTVKLYSLTSGETKSCGCLNRERTSSTHTKHGKYKLRVYGIHHGMKGRCFNKKNTSYHNYGGRGITICSEWLLFDNFYTWAMQNGYKDNLTIERIDNNGNYCPENCKWATMEEQKSNTRKAVHLTFAGETMTMRQWAKRIGINVSTLCERFSKGGMTVEQALTHRKGEKYIKCSSGQ